MTEPTTLLLALIGRLPAILTACAALAAALYARSNGKKTDHNTALTAATKRQADVIVDKTVEIHDLTNSKMDAVKADLEFARRQIVDLNGEIKALRALVATMIAERDTEPR